MFCLRSWVPLLIFLTNASPIYVLLFLTATYIDRRPCVYCSILLFVLVFSLFDFKADWFEPRWNGSLAPLSKTSGAFISGNSTLTEVVLETAGFAVSAINGTGGSLASAALDSVKRRMAGESGAVSAGTVAGGNSSSSGGLELLRALLEKRQIRIPCVDVIVRL